MVAQYYRKVSLQKLGSLLENKLELIEELLCRMIYDDLILGKIDRLSGVLEIRERKTETEVVDEWVRNINQLVELVDFVAERIDREERA